MPRITIKPKKRTELIAGERLRLATVKPQPARIDIVIAQLDIDYRRHVDNLQRIIRKLRKQKRQQP